MTRISWVSYLYAYYMVGLMVVTAHENRGRENIVNMHCISMKKKKSNLIDRNLLTLFMSSSFFVVRCDLNRILFYPPPPSPHQGFIIGQMVNTPRVVRSRPMCQFVLWIVNRRLYMARGVASKFSRPFPSPPPPPLAPSIVQPVSDEHGR